MHGYPVRDKKYTPREKVAVPLQISKRPSVSIPRASRKSQGTSSHILTFEKGTGTSIPGFSTKATSTSIPTSSRGTSISMPESRRKLDFSKGPSVSIPPKPETIDFSIKKGLKKPEPVTCKDISPFKPDKNVDVEMEDNDFIPLPELSSAKYKIDTKKPITKLVDKANNVVKVIPKIDSTNNETPPVKTIHPPTLGEVFDDKNVSTRVGKAFPNIKQNITPEKVIEDLPDALVTEDKEFEKILEKVLNEGKDDH